MKIKTTFVMDTMFNVHVFAGNVQRILGKRNESPLKAGGHAARVWFADNGIRWYRLLHHMGPVKWKHLQDGIPIVDDTFDFGAEDVDLLNGKH